MAVKKIDVLVIGNGVAGNNAALSARRTDPKCSVMILGREKHQEYAAPALPDYLSGELSKKQITVHTQAYYARHGIQQHLNDEVAKIDPKKKLVTTAKGETFRYGKLVLATGSFPIQLRRMKGTDLPGNFVLKTIDDVDAMTAYPGKHAVVVGSGAIGLEGALALKERGYEQVTIVEGLDWISMKSFDRETADEVVKAIRANGVEVYSGEAVVGVEGTDRVRAIRTAKRVIPCDIVLWGIGVRPRVDLAQQTGIALGELGAVNVDDHMRTSIPDIYACGDCTESVDRLSGKKALHLFWEPAARGGMVAGANCVGADVSFNGSIGLFLTYIGETSVVAFGKTELDLKGSRYQVLEDRRGDCYRRILLQDQKIVGVQLVNTLDEVNELLDQVQKGTAVDFDLLQREDSGKYAAMQLSLASYIKQFRKIEH